MVRVHIYEVTRLYVIDEPGEDHEQALKNALAQVKQGKAIAEPEPDTRYLGLIPGNQRDGDATPVVNQPSPALVIQKLMQLPPRARIRAAQAAALLDKRDNLPPEDWSAWLSGILQQGTRERRLHDLLRAIDHEKA